MPKRIITPSSIRNGTKNEAIYRRADLRMKNLETSEKYAKAQFMDDSTMR